MQIVISGLKEDIKNKDIFLSNNVKKYVELNVSAAFHSKFMNNAQLELSEKIKELNFLENDIKIISNFDANPHNDNVAIKNLQKQMAIGLIGPKVLKS